MPTSALRSGMVHAPFIRVICLRKKIRHPGAAVLRPALHAAIPAACGRPKPAGKATHDSLKHEDLPLMRTGSCLAGSFSPLHCSFEAMQMPAIPVCLQAGLHETILKRSGLAAGYQGSGRVTHGVEEWPTWSIRVRGAGCGDARRTGLLTGLRRGPAQS